jgi:hypothetical protein
MPALAAAELPWLRADISADVLLKIRSENEAFEDWRSSLRRATRAIRNSPATTAFPKEARGDPSG